MCVPCLIVSTLTLFTPSGLDLTLDRHSPIPLAQDTQVAITEVVGQLPSTPETQQLREGLLSLQTQLASTQTDAEAKALIDRELATLSLQMKAHPNFEQIAQALEAMVIIQPVPGQELLKQHLKPGQRSLAPKGWGWLP